MISGHGNYFGFNRHEYTLKISEGQTTTEVKVTRQIPSFWQILFGTTPKKGYEVIKLSNRSTPVIIKTNHLSRDILTQIKNTQNNQPKTAASSVQKSPTQHTGPKTTASSVEKNDTEKDINQQVEASIGHIKGPHRKELEKVTRAAFEAIHLKQRIENTAAFKTTP